MQHVRSFACRQTNPASASAGEGHPADEPLLFDTVHSGQLSVVRLSQEAQPLLQLGMPWRAPDDQLPDGITAESAVIQVRRMRVLRAVLAGLAAV